jgi:CelD/BcsL family acetyltransferase involved in cellulose biosynthesis
MFGRYLPNRKTMDASLSPLGSRKREKRMKKGKTKGKEVGRCRRVYRELSETGLHSLRIG